MPARLAEAESRTRESSDRAATNAPNSREAGATTGGPQGPTAAPPSRPFEGADMTLPKPRGVTPVPTRLPAARAIAHPAPSPSALLVALAVALATAMTLLPEALGAPAAADRQDPDASAATWPQWRGPTRDGRTGGEAWPDRLLPSRVREVWRADLDGESYSGPIVGETLVYTTATLDEEREATVALDRATGREVWRVEWPGAMEVPFFAASRGSWIRATPALDGDSLYVAGMRDVLVCLDAATGEERWRVDFTERFDTPLPSFGFVCSPLVVGDHVYAQAGASFVKLDKRTGESVWRALVDDGGMYGSAFSSPVHAEIAGTEQLVVLTRTHLAGVAASDGSELWRREIPAFRGMNILTPVVAGDDVLTAAYGGRTHLFRVSASAEGDAAGDFELEERWNNRMQGHMTSPVVIDGHAYYFTRANRFVCVRLEDGEIAWISPPPGDEYWSLVTDGARILALANTGVLRLIEATPEEYRVIDEMQIAEDETWAHLALVDGRLYVRDLFSLAVFDWR